MKELPKISDAEREVMKVLWREWPLTSSEIIEALKTDTTWSRKTIHTLISRLVKKKALKAKKDTTYYKYYPLVTEEECRTVETKSFIEKVYNGSLHLLVSNFIKEEKLTEEEIKDLKQILDDNMDQ